MIRKVYKYWHLILLTLYSLVKYKVLMLLLSNENFYERVSSGDKEIKETLSNQLQPLSLLNSLIEKIINSVAPSTKCLVKSLVKRNVFAKYGYSTTINLSIYKSGEKYKTHAWILQPCIKDFKTIHTI